MTAQLPRSAWTDTDAAAPALLDAGVVRGLAVHWLGPAAPAKVYAGDRDAVALYLRGVRRFHVVERGWSDIAYQWAVDTTGRRWELRGWRRQSAANGDTVPNQRFGAVLALLGVDQLVTPELLDGLRDAVDDWRRLYPHAGRVVTHNDVRPEPTACPGPELTQLVHTGQLSTPREDDEMPTSDELIKAIAKELRDDESALSVAVRRQMRNATQAELLDERRGDNPKT